jgi:hypothetical protein
MADMADMFLYEVIEEENNRDSYCSGLMSPEEAFERGYLDTLGVEVGMQEAWDRSSIGTLEELKQELVIADMQLHQITNRVMSGDKPTCNTCRSKMSSRKGKFGKFYFCSCPEQVTVSDKYWQTVNKGRE